MPSTFCKNSYRWVAGLCVYNASFRIQKYTSRTVVNVATETIEGGDELGYYDTVAQLKQHSRESSPGTVDVVPGQARAVSTNNVYDDSYDMADHSHLLPELSGDFGTPLYRSSPVPTTSSRKSAAKKRVTFDLPTDENMNDRIEVQQLQQAMRDYKVNIDAKLTALQKLVRLFDF